MKQLQEGVIFQLTTVMKTFGTEEIDQAYELMMSGQADSEDIDEYVRKINFLNKDYLQDVEEVKKYSDYVADRVKRSIGKSVKKVELLLYRMQ